MICYLTFNDSPSGIYKSQVIDVVKFIRADLKTDIRLLAFVSLRNYANDKAKIKKALPDSLVLPMFPGVKRWRMNVPLLKLVFRKWKPTAVIGRSVLATQLAMLATKAKTVYDGRGAISAEWKEYGVVKDPKLLAEIHELEKNSVLKPGFRIAVSHELVRWWEKEFSYNGNMHVIIPCTLSKEFQDMDLTSESIKRARRSLNLQDSDIVFAYSGSVAGWQSFSIICEFMKAFLAQAAHIKLLFLSPSGSAIEQIRSEFPDQVICRSVPPEDVPHLLQAADYGLLAREQSITNKVSSPVKFAEYLACGLKIIISENLGDYSEFINQNHCGYLMNNFQKAETVSLIKKEELRKIAIRSFTKSSYKEAYRQVIFC